MCHCSIQYGTAGVRDAVKTTDVLGKTRLYCSAKLCMVLTYLRFADGCDYPVCTIPSTHTLLLGKMQV